ncbi:hypothetical protein AcW1_005312 [Taiwanofungus camphoratus]|nr:hypothetical protein AcW1_005312 [Antrodia cinnamomea]
MQQNATRPAGNNQRNERTRARNEMQLTSSLLWKLQRERGQIRDRPRAHSPPAQTPTAARRTRKCTNKETETKRPREESTADPPLILAAHHRVIQVLLHRTHLHCNRKTLHHLVAAEAEDVDAHDTLLEARDDQLVQRWLLVRLGDH